MIPPLINFSFALFQILKQSNWKIVLYIYKKPCILLFAPRVNLYSNRGIVSNMIVFKGEIIHYKWFVIPA